MAPIGASQLEETHVSAKYEERVTREREREGRAPDTRPRAGTLQRGSTLELAEALAKGLVGIGDNDDSVRVDLGDDVLEWGNV